MKLRPTELTGKQVRHLKSLGHLIKPLMQVGKGGVTDQFIHQVRKTLNDHELIKVKLIQSAPTNLDETATVLASQVPCHVVQKIGKTALLYNQREKEPEIVLPKPTPKSQNKTEK